MTAYHVGLGDVVGVIHGNKINTLLTCSLLITTVLDGLRTSAMHHVNHYLLFINNNSTTPSSSPSSSSPIFLISFFFISFRIVDNSNIIVIAHWIGFLVSCLAYLQPAQASVVFSLINVLCEDRLPVDFHLLFTPSAYAWLHHSGAGSLHARIVTEDKQCLPQLLERTTDNRMQI